MMTVQMILMTLVTLAGRQSGGLLKYGFLLAIPLTLIGTIALVITIIKFVKMFKDARIAGAPFAPSTEMNITRTGNLSLMLQIPITSFYAGQDLDYRLTERATGGDIELHRISFRSASRRSSLATQTFPVRTFVITKPGNYLLQIAGVDPQQNYEGFLLLIEEATSTRAILYILALILTAAMTIIGFILTFISLGAGR